MQGRERLPALREVFSDVVRKAFYGALLPTTAPAGGLG